jgi:hypothetical protein
MLKLAVTDNFNFVNFIKEYSIFDKNVWWVYEWLIPWGQTNTSELKFYSKLGFREKYKNKFEYVSKPIEYWLLLVYIKKYTNTVLVTP